MKKVAVFLLLAALGFTNTNGQSMLKVRLADNRRINVWLDGRYFNKTGTSVTVGDLPYGDHMLRIYSVAKTRRGRAYEEVVYHGKITTYKDMITLFDYDPYTQVADAKDEYFDNYMKDHPQATTGEWHGETGGADRNNDNVNDNTNGQQEAPVASPAAPEQTGTLSESKIEKLKIKLASRKMDTEKMNLVKEALNEETFTTGQAAVIMDWFGFESSKVEFAEWAYPKIVDKDLFPDLASKLTYQNYRDELEKFIKAQ